MARANSVRRTARARLWATFGYRRALPVSRSRLASRLFRLIAAGSTEPAAASKAISPKLARVDVAVLEPPTPLAQIAGPPVFITGFARSGTTWTLDVFAQHPEVKTLFETWLLTPDKGITGVFHQPQWHPEFYAGQLQKIGMPHAMVQLLPYEEMVADLADLAARWLARALGPEHRYLVDKGPIDIVPTATMFPDARFVHVVRDGRDVSLSIARAAASWAPEMGEAPVAVHARNWRNAVRATRELGRELSDRWLEIRFEDLWTDIEQAARSLFDFAGIPYDDKLVERVRTATDLSQYPENVRASGFRGTGQAYGWRDRMTRDEGRGVQEEAGVLLAELGYEHDPDWWRTLAVRRR
jgi:hypothetical protein